MMACAHRLLPPSAVRTAHGVRSLGAQNARCPLADRSAVCLRTTTNMLERMPVLAATMLLVCDCGHRPFGAGGNITNIMLTGAVCDARMARGSA